jgi:hypothetical protein
MGIGRMVGPSIGALDSAIAERVVALTLGGPPPSVTHWTGAAMAETIGISVSSVQRIWRAHGLQPHRVRQFKLSNDPQFVANEKSQIQALDRTQPALPMKRGRAATMTHDYRHAGGSGCPRTRGSIPPSRGVSFGTDALRPYSLIGRAGQEHGQNSPPNPTAKSNRVLQHITPQSGHRSNLKVIALLDHLSCVTPTPSR